MPDLFPRGTLESRTAGGRQLVAPVANEHQVRPAAGTTMAIGAVPLAYAYFEHRYWPLQVVSSLLFAEFLVRVTAGISRNPIGDPRADGAAWLGPHGRGVRGLRGHLPARAVSRPAGQHSTVRAWRLSTTWPGWPRNCPR